jgi:hypothetical protein
MSIKERLDDARILESENRYSGALLMRLVALAATSRRRYPRAKASRPRKGTEGAQKSDREAFCAFVNDDVLPLLNNPAASHVQHASTDHVPNPFPTTPVASAPPSIIPNGIDAILYEFLRCSLVHEGRIPGDVTFDANSQAFSVRMGNEFISFAPSLLS